MLPFKYYFPGRHRQTHQKKTVQLCTLLQQWDHGASCTGGRSQRHHLALDQVPFYCTLCTFKCSTRDALDKHVVGYKRQALIASFTGANINERRYLVENSNPGVLADG